MGSFRKRIEDIIRENAADPTEAAIAVCVYIEMKFGLNGPAWFDDNVVLARLEKNRALRDQLGMEEDEN